MMMNPKVSVIIPVYNTEAFVAETLQSILNQTLKEIEVIVVNDGSTDGSLAIVNEIARSDDRVQVYSQKNQGQSVARNTGVDKAHGEFVYFMDSDDLLLPNALRVCYDRCCKQNLDFVFFDGDVFCEEGCPTLGWDYHRTLEFNEKKVFEGQYLLSRMLDTFTHRAVPWLLFIRFSFMEAISLRFYPGIIHEDELFTVILYLKAARVGCLKHCFAKHRIRGNSTMTNKYAYRNVSCYFMVAAELLRYAQTEDELVKRIIDKYLIYTLNPVFQTAYSLPLMNRIKIVRIAVERRYLKYLRGKSVLILLFKKLIKR